MLPASRIWKYLGALVAAFASLPTAALAQGEEEQPAQFDKLERRDSAEGTYVANALGLVHQEVTTGYVFSTTDKSWRVVRGNYRLPIDYPTFFRNVGRSDLADSYETRLAIANTCTWTGLAMFLGGTGVGIWGLTQEKEKVLLTGFGIALAGVLVNRIGSGAPEPGVTETEAARLIDRYNGSLTEHLGLPSRPTTRVGWQLSPFAGAKAIGLAGSHRF